MFNKILIANRGEIACRVIKTCKRLGIRTVAVYSDADLNAQHVAQADEAVHIGGARAVDSYLKGDVIIAVAKQTGAQAIHPGYGFLSENEKFATAVEAAGLVFIGPTADSIERMGLKDRAKKIMQAAGVPVVPGYHGENQDPDFLYKQADVVGYPVLIKACAGGGGKGMRLVEKASDFLSQLESAKRESRNAFGDDAVLIERFVQGPHHIEFQVFGDTHGNYVHLFERECSIQRRHQKILEETPSPFLDDDMRLAMGDAAVAAVRAINYRGAGTIEFIVGEDREFFFMEMNTRLQVEHPITEMITGEDLVEWQLRVAAGEELPLIQQQIITGGHAIEVRLCAENPLNDFLPETGLMRSFITPLGLEPSDESDIRVDTGVQSGDEVSVFYDPMIAKIITWGNDRPEAIRRMQIALSQTEVLGVTTNLGFLEQLCQHPAFLRGETDTSFIATHKLSLFAPMQSAPTAVSLIAASLAVLDKPLDAMASPWNNTSGWWLNSNAIRELEFHTEDDANIVKVLVETTLKKRVFKILDRTIAVIKAVKSQDEISFMADGVKVRAVVVQSGDEFAVLHAGNRCKLKLVDPFRFEATEEVDAGRLTALMPGRVVKVLVKAGDAVKKGQALIIMEAMKMEHTIVSPRDGVIERIAFKEQDLVPADALLFAFVAAVATAVVA
jgi:3-methylcrotonyl-CoA carboxylase alpha subunit